MKNHQTKEIPKKSKEKVVQTTNKIIYFAIWKK